MRYPFEASYDELVADLDAFGSLDPDAVLAAALETPMIFIVIRVMLGFTPSEWAYVASQRTGIEIAQGFCSHVGPKNPLGAPGIGQAGQRETGGHDSRGLPDVDRARISSFPARSTSRRGGRCFR